VLCDSRGLSAGYCYKIVPFIIDGTVFVNRQSNRQDSKHTVRSAPEALTPKRKEKEIINATPTARPATTGTASEILSIIDVHSQVFNKNLPPVTLISGRASRCLCVCETRKMRSQAQLRFYYVRKTCARATASTYLLSHRTQPELPQSKRYR